MIADTTKAFTGRKAKFGKIVGLKGQNGLCVQTGYCTNCDAKQLMTLDEAGQLARLFARQKKKLLNRLAISLLRRLEA